MERFSISVGLGPNTARCRVASGLSHRGCFIACGNRSSVDRQLDFEAKKAVSFSFVREIGGFR